MHTRQSEPARIFRIHGQYTITGQQIRMGSYLEMRRINNKGNSQMVKLVIMVGQVNIIPQLGAELYRKSQYNTDGQNPDIPYFTWP